MPPPPPPGWVIQPFDSSKQSYSDFSCGSSQLDGYLKARASQDVRRNLARVFVACTKPDTQVVGFYSLSSTGFDRERLPESIARKLGYREVPAVLIGRLAVDKQWQGKGLGRFLLMDIFYRVLVTSKDTLGIFAVVVHAKDENARLFYQKYGFMPFPDQQNNMFIPLKTLKALVE